MIIRNCSLLILLLAPVVVASAAPTVTFSEPDISLDNIFVTVFVTPDVASFVPNTSLAVELDFTISGQLIGATLNEDFWSVQGINPGNNPFTGGLSEGLVVNTVNRTLFVAVGSELFATPSPVELMTIELGGYGFSHEIEMGGRVVLPGSANEYVSSRIAQNGLNYDGILASCTVEGCLGDYNGDGVVGNADLTLLLDNWGEGVPPSPAGWTHNLPTPPSVGNDELTCFLDNWGEIYLDAAANPEPGSGLLAATAIAGLLATRRRAAAVI